MRVDRRAAAIMRILSGVVALTLLATGSSAQTLPDQQDALRALTSIRVEVQLVGAADRIGIESAEVLGAVESRLREAGITVSRDDQEPTRGDPMLSVTLHAIEAAGGYAFMGHCQLDRGRAHFCSSESASALRQQAHVTASHSTKARVRRRR